VYLHTFESGSVLRAGLVRWIGHYNPRPHLALAGRTPDEVYHQVNRPPSPGLARATADGLRLAA
jgi:hypothetical protein